MLKKQAKLTQILFRIDFIRRGYGIIEKKDYAFAAGKQEARRLFMNRADLWGEFNNPNFNYDINPDQTWVDKHPEEWKRYLEEQDRREALKKKQIQDKENRKDEKEARDRKFCPECNRKLNVDKDFCESCGYPSENFKSQSSWLTKAIEEEGE